MGDQQSLNQLLQWGIENSDSSRTNPDTAPTDQQRDPSRGLNSAALAELLGGPSDADRMRMAMTAILAPTSEVGLEDKLTAWDNFEQLIEQIDNANNMESLGLWQPLLSQLENEEAEMRSMAAWCMNTAVQNNVKCQERLLALGGVEKLVGIVMEDSDAGVRKKAAGAISSEVRNFQPGFDELVRVLPEKFAAGRGLRGMDAGDMEAVDGVVKGLREYQPQR